MKLLILCLCLVQIQSLSISKNTYQRLFNEQLEEMLSPENQRLIQRLFPGLEQFGTFRKTDGTKPRTISVVLTNPLVPKQMAFELDNDYKHMRGLRARL